MEMDWKQKRIVTILSTILAILSAAVLVVLGIRYREHRQADAGDNQNAPAITQQSDYTALTYSNGSFTLSFTLDGEGKWSWTADPGFPLDDTTLTTILAELSSLRPQQTLAAEESMESYGFTDPGATLTATERNGRELTLVFGKATTDGASYYMQMNGDETTVYIVAGALYQHLQTPIYDMMKLPDLPQLPENWLESIIIQGAESTVLTAVRPEDAPGATPTWRSGGANITDSQTVQALLDDLANLAFAKCVDYAPAEEAAELCGLGDTAVLLTVDYLTESGTEQSLTLAVGSRAVDGDGRYIMLPESSDPSIYLLSTALLDPLMQIAANGLEA